MNQSEINACVGKTFQIRGAAHLCVAAGDGALLLLQIAATDEPLLKKGDPVQYIVARYPDTFNGELVWGQGAYFLPDQRTASPTAFALRDAADELVSSPMYVAMADDDLGARCVGVFTRRDMAETALERLINKNENVTDYCEEYAKEHFTFSEFQELYAERGLDDCYWIEEHESNCTKD